MVRVQKDWEIKFISQTSHQSSDLSYSEKLALALGCPNDDRNLQLLCGGEDRFEHNEIGDIEVADRYPIFLSLLQNIA
jgi:hypothetical protein